MNMQTCTKCNPRETEGTKTLLFINIRSYNERSDGSYVYRKIKQISLPFFRSCCLDTLKKSRGHLPLVTSGYYQDGRSLISSFSRSSKMAAVSNSRPWATLKCQNPYPGEGTLSQFPVGSLPPPTLGLNIDRCITKMALIGQGTVRKQHKDNSTAYIHRQHKQIQLNDC